MRAACLSGIFLVGVQGASAQLDEFHWIPPLYTPGAIGGGAATVNSHFLVLTTPETAAVNVRVQDGAGNVVFAGTLSNAAPRTIRLGEYSGGSYVSLTPGAGNILNTGQLNTVTSEALIVTADAPVYANIRHRTSAQGGSLTAKGCPALGTEFRVGVMRDRRSNDGQTGLRGNFVSVTAVSNGTVVTFDDIKPGVVFHGTVANAGDPSDPQNGGTLPRMGGRTAAFSVTLDEGESYTIGLAGTDVPRPTTNQLNNVNGTRVTATLPIVVNSGTFLGSPTSGGGRDIGIDQMAPVPRAGTEFILIKGGGSNGNAIETATVVATVDNTEVFINGGAAPFMTLANAGDYVFITGQYTGIPAAPTATNLYIRTSEPAMVYQTLGGTNSAATPAFNFIPPLDLDIANSVNNIANINQLGNASLSIVARTGNPVTVNGLPVGSPAVPVAGNPNWVTYKRTAPVLGGDVEVASTGPIQVGVLALQSPRAAAGYFSGFPTFKPLVEFISTIRCFSGIAGNTAVLQAKDPSGVLFTAYEWFFEDGTPVAATAVSTTDITDDTLTAPMEGVYFVRALTAPGTPCPAEDSALIAITLCPEPIAGDDVICELPVSGTPIVVSPLGNDTPGVDVSVMPPLDGTPITVTAITQAPARGTAVVSGGGTTISYTPTTFFDQDFFEYEITNAFGLTSTATVLIKNPFIWTKGWYNGLIVQNGTEGDPAATWENTGYIRANITFRGAFTAECRVKGQIFRVTDAFAPDGSWTGLMTSLTGDTVTVDMQIDVTNFTNLIIGTVEPGSFASTFIMFKDLFLERNPGPAPAPPLLPPPAGLFLANPHEGLQTGIMPKLTDPTLPQGYGGGTGRSFTTGFTFLSGRLGDNAPFSSGGFIKWTDEYPFNSRAHRPVGNIHGTLFYEDMPGISDASGIAYWYKPPVPAGTVAVYYFRDGFSTETPVLISGYTPGTTAFTGDLSVEGGAVSHAPFTTGLTVGATITATPGTYDTQVPFVYTSRGSFRGNFIDDTNPIYRQRLRRWFDGIFFEKQNLVLGSFRGNGSVVTGVGEIGAICGSDNNCDLQIPPPQIP